MHNILEYDSAIFFLCHNAAFQSLNTILELFSTVYLKQNFSIQYHVSLAILINENIFNKLLCNSNSPLCLKTVQKHTQLKYLSRDQEARNQEETVYSLGLFTCCGRQCYYQQAQMPDQTQVMGSESIQCHILYKDIAITDLESTHAKFQYQVNILNCLYFDPCCVNSNAEIYFKLLFQMSQ